jgi:hypothetical protein
VTHQKLKTYVADTREELAATLDEIEHRVSPQYLSRQVTRWVSSSYDRNPARWLTGIAVVVVGAVASVLWAVFSNDD